MKTPELAVELANNQYAVAATDAAGIIVDANQKFTELTGYSLTELKQLAYTDITPDDWTIYENKKVIKEVFTMGEAYYQKEYRTKAGNIVPIELNVYLNKSEQGEPNGMWAIVKRIISLSKEFEQAKQLSS